MRITGGSRRGRRIRSPRGDKVRPAGSLVRQAVFNLLGQNLTGVVVLDLYAGTGVFGIEALSRGAAHALFVEKDPAVVKMLARNIAELDLSAEATIYRQDVNRFLKNMKLSEHLPATLIFIDPPFYKDLAAPVLPLVQGPPWLAAGGRVVVKHAVADSLPAALPGLHRIRRRQYGSTVISIYQAAPPPAGSADETTAGADVEVREEQRENSPLSRQL